jgi:hypothetical protein
MFDYNYNYNYFWSKWIDYNYYYNYRPKPPITYYNYDYRLRLPHLCMPHQVSHNQKTSMLHNKRVVCKVSQGPH